MENIAKEFTKLFAKNLDSNQYFSYWYIQSYE